MIARLLLLALSMTGLASFLQAGTAPSGKPGGAAFSPAVAQGWALSVAAYFGSPAPDLLALKGIVAALKMADFSKPGTRQDLAPMFEEVQSQARRLAPASAAQAAPVTPELAEKYATLDLLGDFQLPENRTEVSRLSRAYRDALPPKEQERLQAKFVALRMAAIAEALGQTQESAAPAVAAPAANAAGPASAARHAAPASWRLRPAPKPAFNSRAIPGEENPGPLVWSLDAGTTAKGLKAKLELLISFLCGDTAEPTGAGPASMSRRIKSLAAGSAQTLDASAEGGLLLEMEELVARLTAADGTLILDSKLKRVADLDYVAGKKVKKGVYVRRGAGGAVELLVADERGEDDSLLREGRKSLDRLARSPEMRRALGSRPLQHPSSRTMELDGAKIGVAKVSQLLTRLEAGLKDAGVLLPPETLAGMETEYAARLNDQLANAVLYSDLLPALDALDHERVLARLKAFTLQSRKALSLEEIRAYLSEQLRGVDPELIKKAVAQQKYRIKEHGLSFSWSNPLALEDGRARLTVGSKQTLDYDQYEALTRESSPGQWPVQSVQLSVRPELEASPLAPNYSDLLAYRLSAALTRRAD